MTEFDPEKFEDKYVHYLDELQTAYRNAYQDLHGRYDSTVLKAVDRQVLDESEPFYEGSAEPRSADDPSGRSPREQGGEFRVELPDDPHGRVGDVADHEQFDAVLDELVEGIERELRREFGFADGE